MVPAMVRQRVAQEMTVMDWVREKVPAVASAIKRILHRRMIPLS